MRLTFNQKKYKHLISVGFSVLITWLIPTFCIVLIGLMLQNIGQRIGTDPFKFHSVSDAVMILLWLISPVVALVLWLVTRKIKYYQLINSFSVYPIATFFVSLIPLFISATGKTPVAVKMAVQNTKVFFIAYYAVMVVAFIFNLYELRNAFKKSNWWLFIAAFPYELTVINIYVAQQAFYKLINLKYFSYQSMANMLSTMHFSDVRLMNPLWYQAVALVTASTLLILGVNLSEIIWQKTKKWRIKV